ncbi:hypothetical protein ACFFGH_20580 [Lysobacter korlensis]|uniref:N-acetyltransferase domain-containing protein n=1 Tax=Lysobacter korlensis TaxID=553636 RepID=A0ABV6RTC9_9GAMM
MQQPDDALAAAAARNHADWCELIARSLRISTTRTDDLWAADVPMPQGHSDVVLLRPRAEPDWGAIRNATTGLTVVDSFADQELTGYGFGRVFEAEWIALAEVGAGASVEPVGIDGWQRVSRERFPDWLAEHGSLNELEPSILDVAEVVVLEWVVDGRFLAGAILHSSDGVIGLHDVFLGDGKRVDAWRSLAGLAHARFGHAPLVGFEPAASVAAPLAAGFRVVGPMRVWAHLEVREPA